MRTSQHGWPRSSITRLLLIGCGLLCGSCLLCALLLYYAATIVPQDISQTKTLYPALTINAGFNDIYRVGYWTPVHVTLTSRGTPFTGKLAVQSYTGNSRTALTVDSLSPWQFTQAIAVAKGQQRQFTIYAPHYTDDLITHGFQATLIDMHGKTVVTQESKPGAEIQPGYILVGVLSDNPLTRTQLTKVNLPGQSASTMVSQLTAATMPSSEAVLENFNALVIDNFSTRTLTPQQIMALRIWINRGGTLILVGGPHWAKTLAPLPDDLRPVRVYGLNTLPPHTHLLTFNGNTFTATANDASTRRSLAADEQLATLPLISTASIQPSAAFSSIETILSTQATPLIVQAHQGSGTIDYLALDPSSAPLATWTAAPTFWHNVLESAIGNDLLVATSAQSYDAGPGEILARGGLVSFLKPAMPQGTLAILALFSIYLLLLGPLRALLLYKRPHLRRYNGHIIVSTLVIGALLMYSLAAYERNSAVTDNSVSITQISQDGSTAHTTTYMGVVTPLTGEVNLQLPGNNLAEPITQQYLDSSTALAQQLHNEIPTTVTSTLNATNLTMQNTDRWSLNPVVTEQDQHLQGQLTSHLTLRNNRITGTISNNLPAPLNDAYILLPHNFIPLGHIAAQTTKKIAIRLQNIATAPELTLADQIEQAAGLATQYFPYKDKQLPSDEFNMHMAMLSALSGVGYTYDPCGGSCQTHAITNKGIIYVTGGQIPDPNYKNDSDPLMLTGAPATLIGWTSQRLSDLSAATTVNNISPQGLHLNFIQMPLTLSYTGELNLPRDFVTGNIVDINSFDATEILPGAYSLSSGSVTFSLPIPNTHASLNTITVSVPDLINNPNGQGTGAIVNNSTMHERIYNWRTNTWEDMRLDQHGAFTTDKLADYAGPDQRVLIQVMSRNNNQIYFGKPQLNINGHVP
jgi:Protein of unknown function (DUF1355).